MKLLGSVVAAGDLSPVDRDAMFALMDRIYANMHRRRFDRDLDEKHWVIRLDDPRTSRLVGFSTQKIIDVDVEGLPIKALFSGDTVVDRAHWGDPALASTWGNFALQLIDRYPHDSLYWFLISKGFRTYRYLPLFFRAYHPCREGSESERLRRIVDALGQRIAPRYYDSQAQVIRADHAKEFVRSDFRDPAPRRRSEPHVRFFIERNRNYRYGDELCCLAPLTYDNFTPLAWRMIRAQRPEGCGLEAPLFRAD